MLQINKKLALALLLAIAMMRAPAYAGDTLKTKEIWSVGENGYETYRIPGVVVSAKGTVIAYTTARRTVDQGDWGDSVVVMRRSTDKGKTWDRSKVVAGDGKGITDNGVAIAAKDGTVHFLYQHNYDHVYYEFSKDDGSTFSEPVDITAVLEDLRPAYPWNVVALGPGHAIELKGGRLLVPLWLADGKAFPNGTRQHQPTSVISLYSDDHGKTWHRGDIIATSTDELPNPSESMAVQLPDGRVYMSIRNESKKFRRAYSISPNGATGWSAPVFDEGLFEPICAASIVRFAKSPMDTDSRILFVNPDSADVPPFNAKRLPKPRQNLTLKLSTDGAKTWTQHRVIDGGVAGYSDLTVDSDKYIDVLYEEGAIKWSDTNNVHTIFARFPIEWLMHGDDKHDDTQK